VKIAKKMALGVLAASVLAFGLPVTAAHADSTDTRQGGCYFETFANRVLTQDQNTGVIGVRAKMTAPDNTPDANAKIDCKIQVNGTDAPGTEIDVLADANGEEQNWQQIIFDDQAGALR